MRITKRQLKRIIKEEKAKVLAEQKVRHVVRRRLMEQTSGTGFESIKQAIAGKRVELGEYTGGLPELYIKEIYEDGTQGENILDDDRSWQAALDEEMVTRGFETVVEELKSVAAEVTLHFPE